MSAVVAKNDARGVDFRSGVPAQVSALLSHLGDVGPLVSQLEAMNAALSEQLRHFEAALGNMSQGLCMFDAQSRLVVWNERYLEIFGLPRDMLALGMTQEDICAVLIEKRIYPASLTLDNIREGTRIALAENMKLPVLRELSDGRVLSVLYRPMEGGGWVSTFEDITEQRRNEARIRHLARHDGLTDLPNARTLRAEGGRMLARPAAERSVLAVSYLDLDRFKFVNDTYGHGVGDELLRAVAERIRARLGEGDVVGRLGGDEFAVLGFVADAGVAAERADALMASLSAPYDLSAGRVEIGVSIGVALDAGQGEDAETLLQDADLALRHAKAIGRGTVCLFDPSMAEAARLRRVLEAELHAALAEDQFELNYQPLVDIAGGRTVGVEALLRWHHPEKGLVPPATFIPLAEEIGLIVPLGRWVMRRACRDAASWPGRAIIAVNVSGIQMRQKSFAEMVLEALAESGLPATRLEIEITESALIDDCDTTMRNITTLREAGIRFAIDDFGTGYSSLSYLRRFPIDKIKIDRSFMMDAETSPDALAIIRAVAGLGVSLGITTLVEGVETLEQLAVARTEGINQVQGYLFSRPQPEPSIMERLGREAAAEDGRS